MTQTRQLRCGQLSRTSWVSLVSSFALFCFVLYGTLCVFSFLETMPFALLTPEQTQEYTQWLREHYWNIRDQDGDVVAVGSRQPTKAPVWVTLDVVHGGFASGIYAASLKPGDDRNEDWLTREKLAEMDEMLSSGRFRLEHPENGAFLVLVYLMRQSNAGTPTQESRKLLNEIREWMPTLKFYPSAHETPVDRSGHVCRTTVHEARKELRNIVALYSDISSRRIRNMTSANNAVFKWLPLYRNLIALFIETVDDQHDLPRLRCDDNGKVVMNGMDKQFV